MTSKTHLSKRGPKTPEHLNDQDWLRANSPRITQRYAKQWIAVYHHSIIASGRNPEMVHQNAKLITGDKPFMMKHIEKGIVIL
ncbi:MAG: hypothetical protein KDC45_09025 [Bacteroidetes bacterium]|nr:hypothetical protein [Bacteroidota bacterium]